MKTTTHHGPQTAQDTPVYHRTPVTAEDAFQAIGRLRKEARDEIHRLIRFLDETDDYLCREIEEDDADPSDASIIRYVAQGWDQGEDDEPSLAGITADPPIVNFGGRYGVDLEADYGNGQVADDEPSLGSVEGRHDARCGQRSSEGGQVHWAQGRDTDDEIDAGSEPEEVNEDGDDADREPSLGWAEHVPIIRRGAGALTV